jgi:hypothetical protein
MEGSGCSLNFSNFIEFVIIDVEPILAIVGLACRIIVCLEFNQKLIGGRTEFNLNLFGLIDILFIQGLIFLTVEQ